MQVLYNYTQDYFICVSTSKDQGHICKSPIHLKTQPSLFLFFSLTQNFQTHKHLHQEISLQIFEQKPLYHIKRLILIYELRGVIMKTILTHYDKSLPTIPCVNFGYNFKSCFSFVGILNHNIGGSYRLSTSKSGRSWVQVHLIIVML